MAIVAECFLPEVNGVTNSVLRVVEQLELNGHQAIVIAPGVGPSVYRGTPVERVPGLRLPMYRSLNVGLPTGQLRAILKDFQPDVVHLAAPVVLGAAGASAARSLQIPIVAVYQTDLAGFARRYHLGAAGPAVWSWLRWIHRQADITLAPSTLAAWELQRHGVERVAIWSRGVDRNRFHPDHRNAMLRRRLAPDGQLLVGYVGRLAKEKQIHLLARLRRVKGCKLVIVGDGPARKQLERQLPEATFLGFCQGEALSQAVASLDVFVHTGPHETFCQSIQEALASGVPVIAPASGGPFDLVRHGDNGWLYPANKPWLLRGAVEALVASPALRRTMSARAEVSVQGRSWEALVSELIGHYESVAGRMDLEPRAA